MVEIIKAEEKRLPEILDVWKEFMDFHGDLNPLFIRREDGHLNFERYLLEKMNSDDALVLVAIEDEHVVGYSLAMIANYPPVFKVEKYGMISDMAITQKHRRKGIGEKLLQKNIDWFRSKQIYRVELNVAVNNPVGYPFWQKQGFRAYLHRLHLDI